MKCNFVRFGDWEYRKWGFVALLLFGAGPKYTVSTSLDSKSQFSVNCVWVYTTTRMMSHSIAFYYASASVRCGGLNRQAEFIVACMYNSGHGG